MGTIGWPVGKRKLIYASHQDKLQIDQRSACKKNETIQVLEGKKIVNPLIIFLTMSQNPKAIKEKIYAFDYINIKNFCTAKSPKTCMETFKAALLIIHCTSKLETSKISINW